MKRPPNIVVQLIHIQGPLKGEIQEFSESLISIGRHPSCHLCFPADLTIMSRRHAEILREGNRFRLVDRSTNGTFVNGKRVSEGYLKDGDVLAFAEGGPKVSFLTQIKEEGIDILSSSPPARAESQFTSEPEAPGIAKPEVPPIQPEPRKESEVVVQSMQAPVIIQYGPTLRSFKKVPVTIGKKPGCDFVIDHQAILDRHAEVFFYQNQYWIKDLTGMSLVSVNKQPVNLQSPLEPNDELALSHEGPVFRFLGGGRLAEVEEAAQKEPSQSATPVEIKKTSPRGAFKEEMPKRSLSKIKKFFQH